MKRKATGVRSPGSSGRRFATTTIGSTVGCQLDVGRTAPTSGRLLTTPRLFSKSTSTRMPERPSVPPLVRLAKKRIVGCSRPTQIVGLVAEPPAGTDSDEEWLEPATFQGSLPAATAAPPVSDQRVAEDSKLPPDSGV